MSLPLLFAFWSLVAWLVFRWGRIPVPARVWIGKLLLLAALMAFGVAPFLRGDYSEEVILFIAGPNAYPVETQERSFAALAFGVGVVFLALYAVARWGDRLPGRGPWALAMKLSVAVILLRVYLEKLGVPPELAMGVGIIWLIVPLPIYFGLEAGGKRRASLFWKWLVGYAFGIRAVVLVLMLLTTSFQLGTHFDNSSISRFTAFGEEVHVEPGSWDQYRSLILMPQMILWPGITLVAGALLGLPTYWVTARRSRAAAA